jgi:DNA repair protein RadC
VPLTKGSERYTVVDPMQVFRAALKAGAGAIILAHNHPSGDPSPSQQDRDVTVRIARVGRELGIPLLDHLVFADGAVYSFAEHGEGSLQWAPF